MVRDQPLEMELVLPFSLLDPKRRRKSLQSAWDDGRQFGIDGVTSPERGEKERTLEALRVAARLSQKLTLRLGFECKQLI